MSKKTELIKLTKDLVSFKTTSDNPEEIKNCINYIKNYFGGSELIIKEFSSNNSSSLFVSFFDTKYYDFILNGHIDVVGAKKEQFFPKIKNNLLYGRGTADMKAGVAALMLLMKNLSKNKKKPNIGLMIVTDEELGGYDGTGFLMKKGFSAKFAVGAEPNQAKEKGCLDITTFHKGVLWLKISVQGKSCHASKPWLGENAADKLVQKYLEIKKMFPDNFKNKWENTISLGKISGGNAPNIVPDFAEMILDIRFNENFSKKELLSKIKKSHAVKIEVLDDAYMLKNNNANYFIQQLKKAVENKTKKHCNLLKETGSSDMRFFSEKCIPAVVFGPKGKNYHGKNEYVELESLEIYYEIIEDFIKTNF